MKMRDLRSLRYVAEGDQVNCLYPKHGSMNVLQRVMGEVVSVGTGPSGKYITVQSDNGVFRSLSESKIVKLRKQV